MKKKNNRQKGAAVTVTVKCYHGKLVSVKSDYVFVVHLSMYDSLIDNYHGHHTIEKIEPVHSSNRAISQKPILRWKNFQERLKLI